MSYRYSQFYKNLNTTFPLTTAQFSAYQMSQTFRKLLFMLTLACLTLGTASMSLAQNVVLPHFLSTNTPGSTAQWGLKGYLGQPILGMTAATETGQAVTTGYIRTITQARSFPSFGGETPAPVVFDLALGQNFPNPFNPTTVIPVTLDHRAAAKLVIFNLLGQQIRSFDLSHLEAGQYAVTWDAKNDAGLAVPSGQYFARLDHDSRMLVRKLTLLK